MPGRTLNSQEIRDQLDAMDDPDENEEDNNTNTSPPQQITPQIIYIVQSETPSTSPTPAFVQTTIDSSTGGVQLQEHAPTSSRWKQKSPGRQAFSEVWKYFKFDKVANNSICQLPQCATTITGKNTTNLKKHLKSSHKEEYAAVSATDKQQDSQERNVGQFQLTELGGLHKVKYDDSNPKQLKFNRQIAICFGSNPIPNSFISNDDLKRCFDIADSKLKVPEPRSLSKLVENLVLEVDGVIQAKLNSARRVCISSDIWTKKGMSSSYLGVMATFYDTVDDKKINLVLGVKKFTSTSHTAAHIIEETNSVIDKYGSLKEKIWKSVTDSGSNMVCAFRNNFGHCDDDSSDDSDGEADNEDEAPDDEEGQDEEPESQGANNLPYSRLSCFIHTLLLSLKKFEARKVFANLISSVRVLVKKFASSQVLTGELLKLSGLKLVSFSNTRWNTVYLVFQRLLLVQDSIKLVLQSCGKGKYELKPSDWKLMADVQGFLEPFNKYTDMSSTETTRTISEAVMMIKQLKLHLAKYNGIRNFTMVSKNILEDLECRFSHFFSESGKKRFEGTYLASTLLDPRYRIGLTPAEVELSKKYILSCTTSKSVTIEPPASEFSSNTKRRKFEFLDGIGGTQQDFSAGLEQELNSYLQNKVFDTENDKFDTLKFWALHNNTFQNLSPLALDILSVPLSIAPVERVFSFAGVATQGRRNRLAGDNLEREVFLNKNKHVLLFNCNTTKK